MPLFHHDRDEAPEPGPAEDPARWQNTLAHYAGLPFTERASEVLRQIASALDGGAASADALLAPLLPAIHNADWNPAQEEWSAALELETVLQDAFQMLVLGRLLMRREVEYKGATDISYRLSPDGTAALAAGNVAAVLTRRLPD